jgi:hypothetical protein
MVSLRTKRGMLEKWKNGIMGKPKKAHRVTQHSNIPSFHYSAFFTLLRQNAPRLATGMNGEERPPKL